MEVEIFDENLFLRNCWVLLETYYSINNDKVQLEIDLESSPVLKYSDQLPKEDVSFYHALFDSFSQVTENALSNPSLNYRQLNSDIPLLVEKIKKDVVIRILKKQKLDKAQYYSNILIELSQLTYEKSVAQGCLVLERTSASDLQDLALPFELPVPMEKLKEIRKLLQMTSNNLALIVQDGNVIGLDPVNESTDLYVEFKDRDVFTINSPGSSPLLVKKGVATLPQNYLFQLTQLINRHPNAPSHLSEVVLEARKQTHGTMVVICDTAIREAQRLKTRQISGGRQLNTRLIHQLSAIDGGILLDFEGNCHGLGAILDGISCDEVDPGRGSRFNSSVKYVHGRCHKDEPADCIVFVMSEDGGIVAVHNLIPPPREVTIAHDFPLPGGTLGL